MQNPIQEKLIASAIARKNKLEKADCFDPAVPGSRPNKHQLEVLKDISKVPYRYVTAGNQCLAKGTLVMTPSGPTPIECMRVGDTVYSEFGKPIKVTGVHNNGLKEVADITNRGKVVLSCTYNHEWQVYTSSNKITEKAASNFHRDDRIRRVTVVAPLGQVREPHAYAIAALLGDGCSRQGKSSIHISSGDKLVPNKVSHLLNKTEAKRLHAGNYTWSVGSSACAHYSEWCEMRYAHEKIVDINVIKTWDRESLLNFVAGLIDTDGSIYPGKDFVTFSFGCQALSVVDALHYAVLALWNIDLCRTLDNRDKYKNGPVHVAYTNTVHHVVEILKELDPYLVSPQKKWREQYLAIGGKRSSSDCVPAKWGKNKRMEEVYDITVDSASHLYLLANGMVTHNCGKSQTGAREISWLFTESHPYWTRPSEWGEEPLMMICMGLTTRQIEEIMWGKIKAFLDPAEYKEFRGNGTIQKVVNTKNGNTILFISTNDPVAARDRVQGFVASAVWLDEMPKTLELVEEVQRRLQAKRGYFLATFTPKVINNKIRILVDNAVAPYSKKYKFSMFDNPIYTNEDKEKILASLKGHSQSYINAILYGDWMTGDEMCYQLDYDKMVKAPPNYHQGWRHVAAVDPALKSKLGLAVFAEDPTSIDSKTGRGHWYVVRSEYISGIFDPIEMVQAVESIIKQYNIVRRIYDNEAAWWAGSVSHLKLPTYQPVYKKHSRKGEMMKANQHSLGSDVFIAPWCTDFIAELEEMQWSEGDRDKIIAASKYHLHDSFSYGRDSLPKSDPGQVWVPDLGARLALQHDRRKQMEEKKQKIQSGKTGISRIKNGLRRKYKWTV